jgi:Family of unknown function (DUF6444)
LGVVTFDPMVMVAGFAALLGGVVVFGSNTSTPNQRRRREFSLYQDPAIPRRPALRERNTAQQALIAKLQERIAELERRLGLNSGNCGKRLQATA